jgi:hypothetical protein
MARAAASVLLAVLVSGCAFGTNERGEALKAANIEFQRLDYQMSNVELSAPPYQQKLERLTRRYIQLIHEYDEELGDEEVRKLLEDKAFELGSYCLPCVATLDEEREKY